MVLSPAEANALVSENHYDAASVLGPHYLQGETLRIVTFQPAAVEVQLVPLKGEFEPIAMTKIHASGLFSASLQWQGDHFAYRLQLTEPDGSQRAVEDPYRFPPLLGDLDLYLIGEGTQTRAFNFLGAHFRTVDGVRGVHFAVWAPNARWVSVIGDFNAWDTRRYPMRRRGKGGIWELFIPGVNAGDRYKYHIRSMLNDYTVDKADPFGFFAEVRPLTASRVADISSFSWHDEDWMRARDASRSLATRPAVPRCGPEA